MKSLQPVRIAYGLVFSAMIFCVSAPLSQAAAGTADGGEPSFFMEITQAIFGIMQKLPFSGLFPLAIGALLLLGFARLPVYRPSVEEPEGPVEEEGSPS